MYQGRARNSLSIPNIALRQGGAGEGWRPWPCAAEERSTGHAASLGRARYVFLQMLIASRRALRIHFATLAHAKLAFRSSYADMAVSALFGPPAIVAEHRKTMTASPNE